MKKSKASNAPLNPIRIVVLGDACTGKSSLINVFISANFEEEIAPLIPVAVCTQFLLGLVSSTFAPKFSRSAFKPPYAFTLKCAGLATGGHDGERPAHPR